MIFRKTSFTLLVTAAIVLSACEFSATDTIVTRQQTHVVKFKTTESEFKDEVLRMIPAEAVHLESSVTQKNNEEEKHYLTVKVLNPEEFPNPKDFFTLAGEVKQTALRSIGNVEQYEKLYVVLEEKTMNDGLERSRIQKREVSLN